MNSFDTEETTEMENTLTLPTSVSTFTLCSPQPPSTTPALGITSSICKENVTTVTFTFEIDSNLRPTSNTVAIGNGTGSPLGVFTLNVNAPQLTGSYSYYTCVTVIQSSYLNNSPFDISYTTAVKQPSPRTIRGTVLIIADPL